MYVPEINNIQSFAYICVHLKFYVLISFIEPDVRKTLNMLLFNLAS